jgi:hypothetical protein
MSGEKPEIERHIARITFDWADDRYAFQLKLGQIRELEEKCNAGLLQILHRLEGHVWRLDDVRETIRLGLIGGGTKPDDALKLIRRYVDRQPLFESVVPAKAILSAVLVGVPDDPPKKAEAAKETSQPAETAASPSPPSMAPAPP